MDKRGPEPGREARGPAALCSGQAESTRRGRARSSDLGVASEPSEPVRVQAGADHEQVELELVPRSRPRRRLSPSRSRRPCARGGPSPPLPEHHRRTRGQQLEVVGDTGCRRMKARYPAACGSISRSALALDPAHARNIVRVRPPLELAQAPDLRVVERDDELTAARLAGSLAPRSSPAGGRLHAGRAGPSANPARNRFPHGRRRCCAPSDGARVLSPFRERSPPHRGRSSASRLATASPIIPAPTTPIRMPTIYANPRPRSWCKTSSASTPRSKTTSRWSHGRRAGRPAPKPFPAHASRTSTLAQS